MAFYLAVTVVDMSKSTNNEEQSTSNGELSKTISQLAESVKSIQDELQVLKRGATQIGLNPLCQSGSQDSVTRNEPGQELPPNKRTRVESEGADSEGEIEEGEEPHGPLVPLSEAAAAFIEATFGAKLNNATSVSKAKGQGIPDSRWIRCPKLDSVVSANVSAGARSTDRAASRIQLFWLDVVNPLVFVLEKAEKLELPAEVIQAI